MVSVEYLKNKKVLIFGIGISGLATVKKLKSQVKNLSAWDDNATSRNQLKKNFKISIDNNFFSNSYDFIVMSPGIDIYKHAHKSYFARNFHKIITDIDIFVSSIDLDQNKIIAITGTNGKSTFCKLLHHIIKKNNNAYLLGNYGKPVLGHNQKSINNFYILELSSYQIEYSKFLKSHACAVLNITPDHLQRHKSMKNYIEVKLKIFNSLLPRGRGFVNKDFLYINKINKKNKVKKVSPLKNQSIANQFLSKKNYLPSLSIVYSILRFLKFSNKAIIGSLSSFEPLPHRQELVRKIKSISFINDSKATNFDSANFSLEFYENIYWIAGGLVKKNDRPHFSQGIKKRIIKTYIIGKNISLFKSILGNKLSSTICKTLNTALVQAYRDAKNAKLKNSTILLSPAAASFDQYKNFEHRGNEFKKLVKKIENV